MLSPTAMDWQPPAAPQVQSDRLPKLVKFLLRQFTGALLTSRALQAVGKVAFSGITPACRAQRLRLISAAASDCAWRAS